MLKKDLSHESKTCKSAKLHSLLTLEILRLCLPRAGITGGPPYIPSNFVDAGVLNCKFHICMVCTIPTEPYPQPLILFYVRSVVVLIYSWNYAVVPVIWFWNILKKSLAFSSHFSHIGHFTTKMRSEFCGPLLLSPKNACKMHLDGTWAQCTKIYHLWVRMSFTWCLRKLPLYGYPTIFLFHLSVDFYCTPHSVKPIYS